MRVLTIKHITFDSNFPVYFVRNVAIYLEETFFPVSVQNSFFFHFSIFTFLLITKEP